jgi:dihydrofolate synthase/folylpolyglutamate synthase
MSSMNTRPRTLADWLDYQLGTHSRPIELGLDRVREVWHRLGAPAPAPVVISVGGTNGKGSTVAFLEAMLGASGLRVGAFTSPHLLRYNERVRVVGIEADDDVLVAAFARIEAARAEIPLTYFEFGTLAALLVFADSALDVAVLEVGLGGRLDAVNIIDADAAIVTTVDLDHQDWLGNDRDVIAREKAGIFRVDRPAIIGEVNPTAGLLDAASEIGARVIAAGRDFRIGIDAQGWYWQADAVHLDLPHPALDAPCQHANAAAAIAALHALRDRLGWQPAAIAQGVASARVAARLQRFAGSPELIVDVAHNPQAARVLAQWLAANPPSASNLAVFGALGDKDVVGIVEPLLPYFSAWHLAGLDTDSPRGLTSSALRERLESMPGIVIAGEYADVSSALRRVVERAGPGDRVIAFGSFFVAAAALEAANRAIAIKSDLVDAPGRV